MRRRPKLSSRPFAPDAERLLLALVACAGCFTDYAPNIGGDASTSSAASTSSTRSSSTGADPGESTGTSTGDPLADSHGASESASSTGTTPATTIVFPETSSPPVDPYDACLAQSPLFECGDCMCDKCLDEYTACAADRGCVAIEMCAAEFGCNDAQCLEPCGDVIDMHGGLAGDSLKLAIELSACFNNSCCGP